MSLIALNLEAASSHIHLRNETIVTPDKPNALSAPLGMTPSVPASGLFLLQTEEFLNESQKNQLRTLGIDLIRFVPDHAFVVRVRQARLDQLRALPFVRWLGAYLPEHKVYQGLRTKVADPASTNQWMAVNALLAPDCSPIEVWSTRRLMGTVRRQSTSRLGTVLQGLVMPQQLDALAASTNVLWIEPAPRPRLLDEISTKIVAGDALPGYPDFHAAAVHQLGYDGRDVVVAVADSGLHNGDLESMHPDLAGRVDALLFYGNLEDAADEHSHGTHVAGIVAGDGATGENDNGGSGADWLGLGGDWDDPFGMGDGGDASRSPALCGLGVAPKARLVVQRIFDGTGNYEAPPSNETLTHDAVRAGAVIGSNSWGDDVQGRYDLNAAEFDALVRDADAGTPGDQPYILEFSAGNAGPGRQTMDSPGVAKNVIATGASQNDRRELFIYTDGPETMADFSSRGPCEDGRIKPDLVAPGTWIASLQSGSATDENAWLPISANYQYQGGTSQSGPHASGAAAVFVQYYRQTHSGRTPSPALVKAALINSCTDLDNDEGGTDSIPNMDEGWGRVTLANLIGSARQYEFLDQTVALTNTQVFERRLLCGGPSASLKISLTYTDVPGLPAALPALVNDLDLEVTGPDGRLYWGNQFNAGESIPDPVSRDTLNNVEGVHIEQPMPGEYLIRVRGSRIVEDIHGVKTAPPTQDFALVASGGLVAPGQGLIYFDRRAYRVADMVQVKLIDFDLAQKPSVSVRVRSTSEPAGQTVQLAALGSAGVFAGTLALAEGTAEAGVLPVRDGDALEATYEDASPRQSQTAVAVIDARPPEISAVASVSKYGQVIITWETDEPTSGRVFYSTNSTFTAAMSSDRLSMAHQITLGGLAAGAAYKFYVEVSDEAGNTAANNNQGQFFVFVPQPAPTILLVNQFDDILLGDSIPLSTYTDALDQSGVPYDLWDAVELGHTPTLDNLKSYRILIWRVPEFNPALTASDARNILDYLHSGGSLFMSSMEVLSRLDESGLENFRKNALHVDQYAVDQDVKAITGIRTSSMTSQIHSDLDFSLFPDFFGFLDLTTGSDTFTPGTNAAPILLDQASQLPVGLRYPRPGVDAPGRVVFFSFPFDTLPMDAPVPNNRVDILRQVLSFLVPGSTDVGNLEIDRENYSLPSRVTIEVADASLVGQSSIEVQVANSRSHDTNRVPLIATTEPGVFAGSLVLAPSGTNQNGLVLPARDGDWIDVSYYDVTASRLLFLSALVDTGAPTLSNIQASPDYNDAIVTWTTSEPSDSLVEFADAEFRFNINRTAYDSLFTTDHSVLLTGLLPDTDYYFKVTSRDPAGNTVQDDNKGSLHAFRTLKPVQAPFTDNFDSGATNWQVVSAIADDETLSLMASIYWQLGQPNNTLANQAHSGNACWGTNLKGETGDFAANDLVTPAIHLQGGNNASLTFWHAYDFTEPSGEFEFVVEAAGVYCSTNNGATWTGLKAYQDASLDWELERIDLTPYLGQVIRLAWHYELFAFSSNPRPGWLVDDVSVLVTNIIPGTLVISNNLAQSSYTLDGPAKRQGRGIITVFTNLPPGDYTITFHDVNFYLAPPAQSVSLQPLATNIASARYTFPDANLNQMSDLWESNYFNQLLPPNVSESDADHDGASDLDEFLAGTQPTNAASVTLLTLPYRPYANSFQLDWQTATGMVYRLEVSTNLAQWTPLTDWRRALRTNASQVLSLPGNSPAYLFRLRIQP